MSELPELTDCRSLTDRPEDLSNLLGGFRSVQVVPVLCLLQRKRFCNPPQMLYVPVVGKLGGSRIQECIISRIVN